MEKEHHQWIVHEEEEVEVEDAALERRKFLPQSKDNLVTGVVVSSSPSPAANGGMLDNGVCSVATDQDRSPIQKDDEVAEIDIVGENGIHFKGDKVDHEAVGFGLVAEFVGAGATSSAAVSQNKSSVYFNKQQGTTTTLPLSLLYMCLLLYHP